MQDAETTRENAYDDAVKVMQEAGRSSYKWREAIQKLGREGLNGYRDVEDLRKQAEQRRKERENAEEKERKAKERKNKRLTVAFVLVVLIACVVCWFVVTRVIPNNKYQRAVALRENGQYGEAAAVFTELGDYSDASEQIAPTKYMQAEELRENGQYEEAIALFAELGNYYDAAAQVTETKYQKATNLNAFGKYDEAYAIYVTLTGYKDVDKLLAEDANMIAAAAAARDAKFAVGNYVTFGTYPQTKAGNDATPIEWLVLAQDGNKALLISRYGLDAQPYNKDNTSVTWETCTLRTWLNGTFYNKAFSSAEQAAILTTNVDNSKNQCYSGWSTSSGNNTQDKVFLLSNAEANKYFAVTCDNSDNTKSRVAPTAYAIAQRVYTNSSNETADGTAAGCWWLRSLGSVRSVAANVTPDGSLAYSYVNNDSGSVRPALWVNIDAGIFYLQF